MGWFRTLVGKKGEEILDPQPVLTTACDDKGITLEALSKKSGVRLSTIEKYNVLGAEIPTGTRQKLEKVLGVGSLYGAAK
jgi:lambda repressor-like predicted transcriptional regulator